MVSSKLGQVITGGVEGGRPRNRIFFKFFSWRKTKEVKRANQKGNTRKQQGMRSDLTFISVGVCSVIGQNILIS